MLAVLNAVVPRVVNVGHTEPAPRSWWGYSLPFWVQLSISARAAAALEGEPRLDVCVWPWGASPRAAPRGSGAGQQLPALPAGSAAHPSPFLPPFSQAQRCVAGL